MKKQSLYSVALAVAALAAGYGCHKSGGSVGSGGAIATVNGEPISTDAFYSYMQRKPRIQVVVQGRQGELPVAGSIGYQALSDLITDQLILQVAKDEGLYPSQDQIDKELKLRTTKDPSYMRERTNAGWSLDDSRNEILVQLAREHIVTKGVTVTPTEAKQYISSNKKLFSRPPQADLLYIEVPTAKKAAVDAQLSKGRAFTQVAMESSVAPGAKENGGAFPEADVSKMPPQLQQAIGATAEQHATNWLTFAPNSFKFFVKQKTPAKPMPVDASLIEDVQRQLALEKGSKVNNLNNLILAKLRTAKVQITQPSYQKTYDDTVAAFKSQPAGGGSPGAR